MKKYLIVFTLLSFTFISCQKDFSIDNIAELTSPNLVDTTLLRKFILLDTTLLAPNDTIYVYTFYYDNLRRCSNFKGSIGIDSFFVNNYYNGNDTLIAKRKLYSTNSADSTLDYFNYSTTGKILSDSILEYTSTFGLTNFYFSYQNTTNQSGSITNKSNGNQFEYNNFLIQRDNSNNITTAKDSLFLLVGSSYNFRETTTSAITYDNKICPFYKIFPKHLINAVLEGSTIITLPPFHNLPQKNNITLEIKTTSPQYPGADICNNDYQYIYNSNNYPISMKMKDNLTNKIYKGIFIY